MGGNKTRRVVILNHVGFQRNRCNRSSSLHADTLTMSSLRVFLYCDTVWCNSVDNVLKHVYARTCARKEFEFD